jgi:hypothetical protein
MSIREVTMYQIACDEPECKFDTTDCGDGYWAWSDTEGALAEWEDWDGQDTEDGKHYCPKHRRAQCCGCDTTENLTRPEPGGDWFCPKCGDES